MGIYSRYKYVNTAFGGTGGMIVPSGTTAERDSSVAVGTVRYNTDLGLLEQYNALGWQSVDAPPTVSNIAGTINENTNSVITITGSNFKTGAIVTIEGAAVSGIPRPLSTTFVSTTSLTAATNAAAVNYVGGATFDVKVVNPSGLGGTLSPAGTIDRDPVWSTAAGTYTVLNSARGTPLSFVAADPDGGTITYSLQTGSLPAGASLNTTTGAISGFSAVGTDVSSTFTLRATSSVGSQTSDRPFTILVRAPQSQSFTSNGTFTATFTGTVEYLIVAGGGGGGGWGGGGGAGGVRTGSVAVTPQGYSIVIGGGGSRGDSAYNPGGRGGDSSAFGITANGGGGGGWYNANNAPSGTLGSGGGGGMGESGGGSGAAGTAGQGNSGGNGSSNVSSWTSNRGGGGGGAGGAGFSGIVSSVGLSNAGRGGDGVVWPSGGSTFYGGGGAGHGGYTSGRGIGGAGGGGAGGRYEAVGGDDGGANTGGGGGGAWGGSGQLCGLGGSGIVIVRF